jgi:flavin-dependent dehydrogenase
MSKATDYDCAVIGGGVAGLALAILLARDKRKVILFEKEQYPFHKVCGEYISNESVRFIGKLGVDLSIQDLPRIDALLLSSVSGIAVKRDLSIGGIGLSRYRLDHFLVQSAINCAVDVQAKTRVQEVRFDGEQFLLSFSEGQITAKTVAGAYGKNSNIDAQLNRRLTNNGEKNLYIAVKHHIKLPSYDRTQVEMHNFPGGYCGLSAIEENKVNMSYIARASQLRSGANKISELETLVLSANPFLKRILAEATFAFAKPLVISRLQFGLKSAVDSHILMLGDAAGNIAPLSGNGISMGLRSAAIAHQEIGAFLAQQISRTAMEANYRAAYRKAFSARIRYARMVQQTFGKPFLNDLSFHFLRRFPFLIDYTQSKIHGSEF